MRKPDRLIIITGQTATGKTKLAVEYAHNLGGELINADSRQVYRYLDILSGKDLNIIKSIPVHLYDVCDPKLYFSSHEWVNLVKKCIISITHNGKIPIIVGGTYFYLAHLLYGLATEGNGPDWQLRQELASKTVPDLQQLLNKLSPPSYEALNNSDRNNPHRLIRRIELATLKMVPSSESQFKLTDFFNNYKLDFIGLFYKDRGSLRQALHNRVVERLENGAVKEVTKLFERGYTLEDPGLSANACFEISQFIKGEISYEKLVERWVTIEMQYAKRQYTFMKKDPHIVWRPV